MEKKPRKLQPIIFLTIAMILIFLFHIGLNNFNWIIPYPATLILNKFLNWALFIACLLFLPVFLFSKIGWFLRILLFIVFLLLGFFGFILSLIGENILDSIKFNDHQYFYSMSYMIGDSNEGCFLSKCNGYGQNCEMIDFSSRLCNDDMEVVLIPDVVNEELHVFRYYYNDYDRVSLYYTYGEKQRKYFSSALSGDYDYSLAYYNGDNSFDYRYTLYRCIIGTTTCERLPFEYNMPYGGLDDRHLAVDEKNDNIEVWFGSDLIYTYGENPRCFVEGCTLKN